jgi:hypothetical protein
MPSEVTDDAANSDDCPGATIAGFPALIEAKIVVPPE